jgi:hypothetical protein
MESRVQLIVEVASAPSAELDEVLAIARQLGISIAPQHPGTDDADLARFLVARVPDLETGRRAAARLNAVEAVRAYVKPPPSAA